MSKSLSKKRRYNENTPSNCIPIREENVLKKRICNDRTILSTRFRKSFLDSQHNDFDKIINRANDACRSGKLLSMHLTNFMCHSNLHVEFHSRINFVVGRNGSGKSAILAALVLGLGSSARGTNRYSSIKDFIKMGQSSAKIEITITNDGSQPYDVEKYGDKITIIRTITSTSGTYTIKNAKGAVISRKHDELNRILLYHNIQVDNPVFVLNQDSAREFLKNLEPSKNYQLFLKATQIDTIMEKLSECLILHKSHMEELKSTEQKVKHRENDFIKHQEMKEKLIAATKYKESLKRLETIYKWLLVKQQEDKLVEVDKTLVTNQDEKIKIENLLHNDDTENISLTQQMKEQDEILEKKNSDYLEITRSIQDINKKVYECKLALTESQLKEESLQNKKSRCQELIKQINQRIEIHSSDENNEDIRHRNEKSLKTYHEQLNNLKKLLENLNREMGNSMQNKTQKEMIIEKIKRDQKKCQDNLRFLNNKITNVKSGLKDTILLYGEHIPKVLKEIKQQHAKGAFSQMPLGPIGTYIEVLNSKYRDIIEHLIGKSLLHAFIVNNTNDRRILEGIFSKFSTNFPLIFTTKFLHKTYDVSQKCVKPTAGTALFMKEIRCSNPDVMNCLIDRIRIERILLTDNRTIAEQLTSIPENIPAKLIKVIYFNIKTLMAMQYYPLPKYRMYSSRYKNASFIHVSIDEYMNNLKKDKEQIESKLLTLDNELEHLVQQLPKDRKLIEEKRLIIEKHMNSCENIKEKIRELENFHYIDNTHQLQLLHRELKEATNNSKDVEQKLLDHDVEHQKIQVKMETIDAELEEKQKSLQEIKNAVKAITAKSNEIKNRVDNKKNVDKLNRRKLKELQEKEIQIQKERKEILTALKVAVKAAEKHGVRIESSSTVDEIQHEITTTKTKLTESGSIPLDLDTLNELLAQKEEDLNNLREIFENIKLAILSLRRSLKYRLDFIKKFKGHMSMLIEMSFKNILKLRNYKGNIEINHQEKTLDIAVQPRDHNENAISSTRALSGGERSYSTVAFLISLWSCVDHPFYFLDEYDVFTDEVNREYMTRLLINEGRQRALHQFGFLTPLDMNIKSDDIIKIHRLAAPIR